MPASVRPVTEDSSEEHAPGSRVGEYLYAVALFAGAIAGLVLAWPLRVPLPPSGLEVAAFVVFALFTISIGYEHPSFGYVSFDRVAQVSCVLVLGPINAAWINGFASLLYPWHRLRKGVPLRSVVTASLTNAGLMSLMVLGGGRLYAELGGPVPLAYLDVRSTAAIAAMLVAMQAINVAGMMVLARARGQSIRDAATPFDTVIELTAGLIGVLVAIVWTRMDTATLLLLLAVLIAGMVALKRFAEMRLQLERLVEERTAALQEKTLQLERLAALDKLTGLYNRRHADAFLERELAHAAGNGHPISVALADVDHFKRINDGYSHAVGDRVLERVAEILVERMRECDLVARYGGEEFVFCLVGMDAEEAARFCEELRVAVERERWSTVTPGLQVTLSIGLVTRRHETTARALLHHADAYLYRAKNLGRNRLESRG